MSEDYTDFPKPTPELHDAIARERGGLFMKYFVLKPAGDDLLAKASRAAMFQYARFIKEDEPEFSNQVRQWAERENAAAFERGAYDEEGSE